jgi:hypothetical protein
VLVTCCSSWASASFFISPRVNLFGQKPVSETGF